MTGAWRDLLAGDRWRSPRTLWVEDGTAHTWAQVDGLAAAVETEIRGHRGVRVVRVRSASRLGCLAGQLAAWRAGCVAVADTGTLGPAELDRIRPDLTLAVEAGTRTVEVVDRAADRPPGTRIPAEVVAVNLTSGTTGTRKAVGVTAGNLLALFGCRGLDVPTPRGTPTAGSFATPTFDGWWFDTWRTVAAGGTVVCLPDVNEDVFGWPELTAEHGIDRVLLPAAVVATVVEVAPDCIAGIPWVFSGGEQFRYATYRRAREAGLRNRFVNLYGPTEATFATHRHDVADRPGATAIPIGRPLDGCRQRLDGAAGADGSGELVVDGPLVCAGYLDGGVLGARFGPDGAATYRTGDLVRLDEHRDLVFVGRLDSQLKVNGMRVDAADLERRVTGLSDVVDCRVVQDARRTVAFVRAGSPADSAVRATVERVVREFSPAIGVQLVARFPTRSGGKVDTASLITTIGTRTEAE